MFVKLSLNFFDVDTLNVRSSVSLFGSDNFIFEVQLIDDDFIERLPNVFFLHSVACCVCFGVFESRSDTERFLDDSILEGFGNFRFVKVALSVDGLLDSVDVSVLNSLDDVFFFIWFHTI